MIAVQTYNEENCQIRAHTTDIGVVVVEYFVKVLMPVLVPVFPYCSATGAAARGVQPHYTTIVFKVTEA